MILRINVKSMLFKTMFTSKVLQRNRVFTLHVPCVLQCFVQYIATVVTHLAQIFVPSLYIADPHEQWQIEIWNCSVHVHARNLIIRAVMAVFNHRDTLRHMISVACHNSKLISLVTVSGWSSELFSFIHDEINVIYVSTSDYLF
jgi:hypothetical protein